MGRSRSPLADVIGLLAWLGVLGLVVRARLDVVLADTHPPDGASYDLPLLLTPSAVDHIGDAVRAWRSLSTEVPGVDVALGAIVVDALAAALLLGGAAIALRALGSRLAPDGDPGRATIGRAALTAFWFAIAAIALRLLGDAGAWLLVHETAARGAPGSLDVIGSALAIVEGAGLALAAAALGILGVAATWAALWRGGPRGSVVRALLTVRLHVVVVAFFGVLVLAPIIGPQLDDVILRWAQEPGDALIAVAAMLWLGLVLLVATDHLLRHEREPPRNTSLRGMLAVTAAVGALGILMPGLLVPAGILLVLSVLSIFFRTIDDSPQRTGMMARREAARGSLVPLVLAVAPVAMLGMAVVRAAAGEAALGGGVFVGFVAGGIVAPPLLGLLIRRSARRGLRPVVIVSVLVALVLVERIVANPWRWGDLLGVIGTFASFAVILSLLALAIGRIDQVFKPPPVLLALGQRRLPILAILALWVAGIAVALPDRGYHDVRVLELRAGTPDRVAVARAWRAWLRRNALRTGAPAGGPRRGVPLVLVAASGGGIRAAYWTARVVDCAIDRRGRSGCAGRSGPASRVFAASGNSGGSVGLAAWAAHRVRGDDDPGRKWVDDRLGEDYFAAAWARTLFSDLPESLLRIGGPPDRGAVLERAWEQSWSPRQKSFASLFERPPPSSGPLTQPMLDLARREPDLPLLLFSGTSVTDGCRTNTSRLRGDALKEGSDRCGSPDPFAAGDGRALSPKATFGATRDVFDACEAADLRLSTAALLSARFPIISPAGRVDCGQDDELRIVDGGYFDDSAASPVQELWARLAPLVDDFNRSGAGRCVVPVVLQIDNAYVSTAPPSDAAPPELVAPLSALVKGRFAREAGAAQALAIAFGRRRLDDGSLPRAGRRALERYVQIFPRAQPGAQAPLGWTLSGPSRESLARQVESTPNARALREVRRWFQGSLRCE